MRLASLLVVSTLMLSGCDDPDAQSVQGEVRLAPGSHGGSVGASDALFISARPAGQKGGPPLAVLKIVGMRFPVTYKLGQEDVVIPGNWFRGKVDVRASLHKSGFVSVDVPGDLQGGAKEAVEPGAKGVDIELAPAP